MATVSSADDRRIALLVTIALDDQAKAALQMSEADLNRYARSVTAALGSVEAGATRAGAAMSAAAQVAGDEAKISRAATGWDRVAAKYDETTRAANNMVKAQLALKDADAALKARLADTTITATEHARVMQQNVGVLETLNEKLGAVTAKYVEMKVAAQQATAAGPRQSPEAIAQTLTPGTTGAYEKATQIATTFRQELVVINQLLKEEKVSLDGAAAATEQLYAAAITGAKRVQAESGAAGEAAVRLYAPARAAAQALGQEILAIDVAMRAGFITAAEARTALVKLYDDGTAGARRQAEAAVAAAAATAAAQTAANDAAIRMYAPARASAQALAAEILNIDKFLRAQVITAVEARAALVKLYDDATAGARRQAEAAAAAAAAAATAQSAANDAAVRTYAPARAAAMQLGQEIVNIDSFMRAGVISAAEARTALLKLYDDASAGARRAAADTAAQEAALDRLQAKYDKRFAASQPSVLQTDLGKLVSGGRMNQGDADAQIAAAHAKALDDERRALDPVYASSMRYAEAWERINTARAKDIIDSPTQRRALDALNQSFAASSAPLNMHKKNIDELTGSTAQSQFAMRQLGVQTVQAFSGFATGQPIMMTLIQQGHQIVDVSLAAGVGFGTLAKAIWSTTVALLSNPWVATGLAVTAVVGSLGVMAYVAESAARSLATMRQQLGALRPDFEAATLAADKAGRLVANTTTGVSTADATKTAQAFASVPAIVPESFAELTRMTVGLSKALGADLPAATAIAVKALTDPAAAANDMAGKLRELDSVTLATILRMAATGNQAGATALLMSTLTSASKTAKDEQTNLQTALTDLSKAFSSADGSGRGFGTVIGEAVTNAVALAIRGVTSLIEFLKLLKAEAMDHPPLTEDQKKAWSDPLLKQWFPSLYTGTRFDRGDTGGLDRLEPGWGRNNPTNLTALPGQAAEGRFRTFPSMEEGIAAAVRQFQINQEQHGTQTLRQQITRWAPPNENDTEGYIRRASGATGINPDAQLNTRDVDTMRKLIAAVQMVEFGAHKLTPEQINTGVDLAMSRSGATAPPTQQSQRELAGAKILGEDSLDAQSKKIKELTENEEKLKAARDKASDRGNFEQVTEYTKLIDQNSEALKNAYDQTRLTTRAQEDAARVGRVVGEAQAGLLKVQLEIQRQREDDRLHPITDEQAAAKIAALLAEQQAGYVKLSGTMDVQIAAQDRVAAGWANGARGAALATAAASAHEQVLKFFADTTGPAAIKAEAELTDKYLQQAAVTQKIAAAQDSFNTRTQSAYIDAETASLGMNFEAREAMLAHMQNEAAIRERFPNLAQAGIDKLVAEHDALEANTRAFANNKAALDYISNAFSSAFNTIGDAITQAFVQGQGAAVNWGNVTKAVVSQVLKSVLELSLINPLKNWLSGGNAPSISGVLGALGLGGGAGAQQPTGQQTQNTNSSGTGVFLGGNAGSGGGFTPGQTNFGWVDNGAFDVGQPTSGAGIDQATWNRVIQAAGGVAAASQLTQGGQGSSGGGIGGILSKFSDAQTVLSAGKSLSGLFGGGSGGSFLDTFGLTGNGGMLNSIGNLFSGSGSGVSNLFSPFTDLFSTGGFFGSGGTISNLLATPIFGAQALGSGATNAALAASGFGEGGASSVATLGSFNAAGGIAPTTIGGALGGLGAGFGAGALAGGLVQSALGKEGPGPMIGAGVGALAGGAAFTAGLVAAPFTFGLSALIGGIIGGVGGGLIGPKPKSPFSSTYVGVTNEGELSLGATRSQLVNSSAERAAANQAIITINAVMKEIGTKVTYERPQGYSALGVQGTDIASLQIGQNSPKGPVDVSKYASLEAAFPSFRFSSNQKQAESFYEGRSFAGIEDLAKVGTAVKQFVDILSTTDAASEISRFLDSAGSLAHADIPAKLAEIVEFVTKTVPNLLQKNTIGSFATAINAANEAFAPAIAKAHELAYKEAELTAERDRTTKAILDAVNAEQAQTEQALSARYDAAHFAVTDDKEYGKDAALRNFDKAAEQQRADYSAKLIGIHGEAWRSTVTFADEMAYLERTLQEERKAIVVQSNAELLAAEKQATSTAASFIAQLHQYTLSLQSGADSPLSPELKLSTAQTEFNQVNTKAQAGDATAMTELSGSASTLLAAAKAFYGSGSAYTNIFSQVVQSIKGIANKTPEDLTKSFLAAQNKTASAVLSTELGKLRADVSTLEAATVATQRGTTQAVMDAAVGAALTPAQEVIMLSQHADSIYQIDAINTAASQAMVNASLTNTAIYVVRDAVSWLTTISQYYFDALYAVLVKIEAKAGTTYYTTVNSSGSAANDNASWYQSGGGGGSEGAGNNSTGGIDGSAGSGAGGMGGAGSGSGTGGGSMDGAGGSGGGLYAKGGWIGNGVWNRDSVRAGYAGGGDVMLAGGEFVMSAPAAARYADLLPAMNAGHGVRHQDNVAPIVRELQNQGITGRMTIAVEMRQSTAAMIEELRALRAEVAQLKAEVKRGNDKPQRLAS